MIQIIDYGAGNLRSVSNALKQLGQEYEIISSPKELKPDAKIIFPGVGAANAAMRNLKESGFADVIPKIQTPFLGICLGMQLLLPYSEEGDTKCLGVINGTVRKFSQGLKVPQIGWNLVKQIKEDQLFQEIPDDSYFYFVNSYYVNAEEDSVLGLTDYGTRFASVIRKDNFYGVQFHPEKSGEIGLKLLLNFYELC
jgi:glutamine amidotransferase